MSLLSRWEQAWSQHIIGALAKENWFVSFLIPYAGGSCIVSGGLALTLRDGLMLAGGKKIHDNAGWRPWSPLKKLWDTMCRWSSWASRITSGDVSSTLRWANFSLLGDILSPPGFAMRNAGVASKTRPQCHCDEQAHVPEGLQAADIRLPHLVGSMYYVAKPAKVVNSSAFHVMY